LFFRGGIKDSIGHHHTKGREIVLGLLDQEIEHIDVYGLVLGVALLW